MIRFETHRVHRALQQAMPVLLCASLAVPALAGPNGASAPDAETLFRQGKAEGTHGHWQKAASLLQQAWHKQHSYDIAGNLGIAELKTGHTAKAARYFSYCIAHFPVTGDAKKMKHVEGLLAQTKKKVAELDITVKPATASVTIDGTKIDRDTAGTVFVEPGSHSLQASADGYDALSKTVSAAKGSKQAIALELAKTAAADPHGAGAGAMPSSGLANTTAPAPKPGHDTPAVPPDTTKPPLWPVWVGSGVAVVGLGLGMGFRVAASSKRDDADRQAASLENAGGCGPGSPNAAACAALKDANASVDSDNKISTGAFVGAGIGAVFGIGYLIWRGSREQPSSTAFAPVVVIDQHRASAGVVGCF